MARDRVTASADVRATGPDASSYWPSLFRSQSSEASGPSGSLEVEVNVMLSLDSGADGE